MHRLGLRRSSLVLSNALAAVALSWLGVAGCGGDANTGNLFDDDGGMDATSPGVDAPPGPDGSQGEGGGGPDAGRDGGRRDGGGRDAGAQDAPADEGVDTGVDSGGVDAGVDTGVDSGIDSGIDAGIDSGIDAGIDAGVDAGIDSGIDAGQDSGIVCDAPNPGELWVSPSGSDTKGTGSQTCPFQTITHAISKVNGSSPATTIDVVSGTVDPNGYGAGCTAGAGGCDATPILVPASITNGLTIQGTAPDPALAVVTGGTAATDTAVFDVRAPGVGFQNLTVAPRHIAAGTGGNRKPGAVGISLAAPMFGNGRPEALILNAVIDGVINEGSTESTSSGIRVTGGTSPTIGPDVTIIGGDHSVLVTDSANAAASSPIIATGVGSTTFFHSTQFACVRVESGSAANAAPSATLVSTDQGTQIHLQDCGGNGAVVVDTLTAGTPVGVQSTLIDASAASATTVSNYGIRLVHAGRAIVGDEQNGTIVNITLTNLVGIEARDTSRLETFDGVDVTTNHGVGVSVTGAATAQVTGLLSMDNGSNANGHGLSCDSAGSSQGIAIAISASTFLQNRGDGVFIHGGASASSGCVAFLGDDNAPGNNVFDNTQQRNGLTGLCYTTTNGPQATPTGSTWSCGVASGSGCQAASPPTVPVLGVTCAADTDYSGTNVQMPATGETCCGN